MTWNTFQKSWWWRLTFRVLNIWKASFSSWFSSFSRVTLARTHKLILLILPIFWFILKFIIDYFLLLGRKYSLLRFSCIFHLLTWIIRKLIKSVLMTILNILRCSWIVFKVIFWSYCSCIYIFLVWISFWSK